MREFTRGWLAFVCRENVSNTHPYPSYYQVWKDPDFLFGEWQFFKITNSGQTLRGKTFAFLAKMSYNRANICCLDSVSAHEKELFVKGGSSKTSLSIAVAVCKAAIPTQE